MCPKSSCTPASGAHSKVLGRSTRLLPSSVTAVPELCVFSIWRFVGVTKASLYALPALLSKAAPSHFSSFNCNLHALFSEKRCNLLRSRAADPSPPF
jgi:hypothetical protein